MGVNSTNMGQPQPLQLSSILSNATGFSLSSSSNQLNNVSGLSGGGSLSGGNLNNNLSQQELLQLSMSRQSTPHLGGGGGGGLDHTNIYHDASGGSPRNVHPHPTQGISQSNSSNYLDYHLGGVDLSPTRSHGDHLPSHLPFNIPPKKTLTHPLDQPLTSLLTSPSQHALKPPSPSNLSFNASCPTSSYRPSKQWWRTHQPQQFTRLFRLVLRRQFNRQCEWGYY